MTRELTLVLPWPPSLNRIWRAVGGRVILSDPARAYKLAAINHLPKLAGSPLSGRLDVTLHLHPPSGRRKYDIANREKLLFDFLTEQRVWLDDEQIDRLTIVRGVAQDKKGYAHIFIRELTQG